MDVDTAPAVPQAGASLFVAGSAVFGAARPGGIAYDGDRKEREWLTKSWTSRSC